MRKDLSGDHARDTHRGDIADDNYAREGGWSGGGRADDYVRVPRPTPKARKTRRAPAGKPPRE